MWRHVVFTGYLRYHAQTMLPRAGDLIFTEQSEYATLLSYKHMN